MLAILLLLGQAQAADTSGYATPALRAIIQRAESANAAPPPDLRGYTARYESEVGLVKRLPDRIEGASTIEQTAGEFTWVAGRGFGQHEQGYRVVTTGVPLPGSAALANGWIMPTLTGPKLGLFGANSGAPTEVGMDSTGRHAAWSPLGPDRDRYYRFEGGDTLTVEFPVGPPQRVVRVTVVPWDSLSEKTKVFRGDIYLDPATGVLRRLRGQFLTVGGPPPEGKAKRLNSIVLNAAVADLVTTEVPGAGWIPTYQRIELEVLIPLTTESWSTLRVMTALRDVTPDVGPAGEPAAAEPMAMTPGRSAATKDSLRGYREWQQSPDKAINSVTLSDLFDVGPLQYRPDGSPIYFWRGPTTLQALRFNRVEGLYTGVSGTLRLRDAMPGLELRGTAGYAWWPSLFRGGISATLERDRWSTNLKAMRDLDLATKFPDPLDYNRGLRALFQLDNYDYVDRLTAGAGIGRFFSARGAGGITARLDYVKDRSTVADLSSGPLGQDYTINPYVTPYEYPRVQAAVTWNPQISSHYTRPGIGLHATYEAGGGDLPYQRIQAGFVARANWKAVTLTIVADGGITISDAPPTQQLFLIGGSGSMPGYDYDQFGGDVGALTRWMIAVPLPFLQAPLQIGGATIPPIAPNLSYRFYSGYTDVTDDAAQASLDAVGTKVVDGVTQPFSARSDGVKSTQEIRLSLFGTLLGFGAARPLEGGDWTFTFSFAQSF
ncbi:MAG TPA: hypothetical protein PLI70_09120 [Gemmatimonadales bacterium]|nr:hypothetical protein [Gemmatimonadales bacterium]